MRLGKVLAVEKIEHHRRTGQTPWLRGKVNSDETKYSAPHPSHQEAKQ